MPVLSAARRRAGRELGSASAVSDSKQTLLCTYLSAVLLVGLLLNSLFRWSWADPLAALVIAAIAVRGGLEAWRGRRLPPQPHRAYQRHHRGRSRLRLLRHDPSGESLQNPGRFTDTEWDRLESPATHRQL